MIKPLDFVKYDNHIGIVTEVSEFLSTEQKIIYSASIAWIGKTLNQSAWWQESSLQIIDNLPNLLTRKLRHPFSSGKKYEEDLYPIEIK